MEQIKFNHDANKLSDAIDIELTMELQMSLIGKINNEEKFTSDEMVFGSIMILRELENDFSHVLISIIVGKDLVVKSRMLEYLCSALDDNDMKRLIKAILIIRASKEKDGS